MKGLEKSTIRHRIIKLKSQPKWVVRTFILAWVLLWGIFAFVWHPIVGTNAENIDGNIVWNNDNLLDHSFRAQNPSDEDIIDALYWSEWDTTAYTLWWPSTCTNMSVVHITTSNWLPTTLNANTIYVLDTGTIIKDVQVNMSNCSAIISSLENMTTFYSTIKKSAYEIYIDDKQYCILDNLHIDWRSNSNWGSHSKNQAVIFDHWSKYNTIHLINVHGHTPFWIWFYNGSNYNKLYNIIAYDNWETVTRWAWVGFNTNSNYNFAYWISGYSNTDAWIWMYNAHNNVVCDSITYNNWRLGLFHYNGASKNIVINFETRGNPGWNIYSSSSNYYYWTINTSSSLALYQLKTGSQSNCTITYNITWSTDQNVIATL